MLGGMASPAEADAPAPAPKGTHSGWGTGVALGMIGFIVVVEFVLPGFLAAGFSRVGGYVIVVNDSAWDGGDDGPLPIASSYDERAVQGILAPSAWLMKRSEAAHRFYLWQYRAAGGIELYFND